MPHAVNVTSRSHARRVLISSLAGTTIEWYDFFIYGTASTLVLGKVFFPSFNPVTGTLLALSTFAIAFVARPVGGALFGHLGDRLGRKRTLIVTLSMMGGATFLVGLLPGYGTFGVAAPVLLVVLRLIQGLSLGGEYGGAVLMTVEHSREQRRGFFGGIVNTGAAWGSLLATLVFLAVSTLSKGAFDVWGWRIPFLASAILVGVGMYMRVSLMESPEFTAAKKTETLRKAPVADVFRRHIGVLVLMALSYISAGATFYIGTVFSLSYFAHGLGGNRNVILQMVIWMNVLTLIALPFFAWLTDRINRKAIFMLGIVGMAVLPLAWFPLLGTRNYGLVLLGFILLFIPYAANYGAMPTFYAHLLPAPVRYTGLAIGYSIGTVLGSATAPLIATFLLGATGGWPAIAGFMAGFGAVSLAASVFLHERRDRLPAETATNIEPSASEEAV